MLKKLSTLLIICLVLITFCLAPNHISLADEKSSEPKPSESKELTEEELAARKELLESEEAKELRERFLALANEVEITDKEVVFTDDTAPEGKEHRLPKGMDNVAVLYGSYTTLWYEAGGKASYIVGGENIKTYEKAIGRDISQDKDVTVVADSNAANNWDVETIIAARPSLIICAQAMSGYATISGPAEAAGIEVICLEYDTFSDYLKWFKVFANLGGEPELFDDLALKVLDEIILTILACPEEEGPDVAVMFASPRDITLNTKATNLGSMLLDLKAHNVVDDWDNPDGAKRLPVNLELLYKINPEKILFQTHTTAEKTQAIIDENYADNPVWQELEAIKNDELYILDQDLFHRRPNARFAEAYKKLAQILYPDIDFGLDIE